MKAIIVGHGPSILAEKMGHLIDQYDLIIRLKRCQETLEHPEFFGSRTDIVGGSWTIAPRLKRIGGAKRYWVFTDSRHEEELAHESGRQAKFEAMRRHFEPYDVVIDKELCDRWDAYYRSLRDEMGGHGHAHTSQGMKAVIYACVYSGATDITLAGFDNVMTGDFTWSITRGPEWEHYPDHRWDVESKMLQHVSDHYGIPIGFLVPTEGVTDESSN